MGHAMHRDAETVQFTATTTEQVLILDKLAKTAELDRQNASSDPVPFAV